jgi:hypothetical protein
METAAAQAFTLVFFCRRFPFERQDISHEISPMNFLIFSLKLLVQMGHIIHQHQ